MQLSHVEGSPKQLTFAGTKGSTVAMTPLAGTMSHLQQESRIIQVTAVSIHQRRLKVTMCWTMAGAEVQLRSVPYNQSGKPEVVVWIGGLDFDSNPLALVEALHGKPPSPKKTSGSKLKQGKWVCLKIEGPGVPFNYHRRGHTRIWFDLCSLKIPGDFRGKIHPVPGRVRLLSHRKMQALQNLLVPCTGNPYEAENKHFVRSRHVGWSFVEGNHCRGLIPLTPKQKMKMQRAASGAGSVHSSTPQAGTAQNHLVSVCKTTELRLRQNDETQQSSVCFLVLNTTPQLRARQQANLHPDI